MSCSVRGEGTSTWSAEGSRLVIQYSEGDTVDCSVWNSPETPPVEPEAPVGGVVMPANTLALVAPWLAVIGVVACIGTAVVVAKKREL